MHAMLMTQDGVWPPFQSLPANFQDALDDALMNKLLLANARSSSHNMSSSRH